MSGGAILMSGRQVHYTVYRCILLFASKDDSWYCFHSFLLILRLFQSLGIFAIFLEIGPAGVPHRKWVRRGRTWLWHRGGDFLLASREVVEAEVRIESPDPEATVEGLHWLHVCWFVWSFACFAGFSRVQCTVSTIGLPFSHYMAGSVETDSSFGGRQTSSYTPLRTLPSI